MRRTRAFAVVMALSFMVASLASMSIPDSDACQLYHLPGTGSNVFSYFGCSGNCDDGLTCDMKTIPLSQTTHYECWCKDSDGGWHPSGPACGATLIVTGDPEVAYPENCGIDCTNWDCLHGEDCDDLGGGQLVCSCH